MQRPAAGPVCRPRQAARAAMSFALCKAVRKELLSVGWAGRVDEAAVPALAQLLEEKYGGQLEVLPDLLRACASGMQRQFAAPCRHKATF